MAGAGKGEQEPPLDEPEKARWRRKAVLWLISELSLRAERRHATPEARAVAETRLGGWKENSRLAGIRDAAAISSLLADEQVACRAPWSEVDAVLARLKGGRP